MHKAREMIDRLQCRRTLTKGSSLMSSSLPPLLEKSSSTSPGCTLPMSPCRASVGLRNEARVPVDTRIWASFCAMKPLLPTPVRCTVPGHAITACSHEKIFKMSVLNASG